ncbi:trypsin CFT-1-like [Battus philenor]|uniref:trypsin CFT-1-like n=1 Tax=Battus philenor TaxID=42288 RepID=UPI0035CF88EC
MHSYLAAVLLILDFTTALVLPRNQQRIIGGSITTIDAYPYASSLLYSWDLKSYSQACGGAILTNRAILSAAHCFYGDTAIKWRIRVGSSWANSGGTVHNVGKIVNHPNYNYLTFDNDIAILQSATVFTYSNRVRAGSIAGSNYQLADNQAVWAIGWGVTQVDGSGSEQLRNVQVWTINQTICRSRYAELRLQITDNMLCSGWLDVGGRDQCQGDSGGPLLHNRVIVGVCSWGQSCALARYPGVNTRVSRFTSWIQANV